MRFGLFFLLSATGSRSGADVYRDEVRQMILAEELGYDAIWIGEHHFSPYGTVGSAVALSAFVAGRTSRIRIGQAVNVLPLIHPIRLAEDAAMVDVVSEGRLNFGIGRGYSALEYGGLGVSMDESRERFSESIDLILEAWRNEAFSFSGKYFQVPHVSIHPRPVQRPLPPIWMACTSPPTISWAADRGFAYLQDHMQPIAALAQSRQTYAERLRQSVPSDRAAALLADSAVARCLYLSDDDARARREPEPYLLWYQSALAKYGASARDGSYSKDYTYQKQLAEQIRDRDYPWYLDNVALFGDPSRVIEDLHRFKEATGVEHVHRNLRLFAERVMPHV